jgi:hypothetical protein
VTPFVQRLHGRLFRFNCFPRWEEKENGAMPTPAAVQPNVTVADPNQVTPPPEPEQGATPESFEAWLDTQDEPIKALVSKRFETLEHTVRATREERDGFSKQIKALAKGQAEGSDAKKQLEEMGAQLEKTEKRAAFLEDAMKPEIQCRNARAAWLIAEASDLFDKKGLPDWAAIKREAPELFGQTVAHANAGQGTQQPPSPHQNMNSFIRKAAGRGG